jgi:hypothetical protein
LISDALATFNKAPRDQSGIPSHLHEVWTIERYTGYCQMNRRLLTEHEPYPDLPFWLTTLRNGVHQSRELHGWCDQMLAKLEKIGKVRNKRG